MQKVTLIYNPISGKGKAATLAGNAVELLKTEGYEAQAWNSKTSSTILDSQIAESDLLVVVGGDGTLLSLLPKILKANIPVWMIPGGNESLFSREFSMSSDAITLIEAIRRGKITEHFVPQVQGIPFYSMTSLGLDSIVVAEIARGRVGAIGHRGYLKPLLKSLSRFKFPRISLRVDGEKKFSNQRGYLIVANSPQYALGIQLVPEANSQRPELCARFFPFHNSWEGLRWSLARLVFKIPNFRKTTLIRGKIFEISTPEFNEFPLQADGEALAKTPCNISFTNEKLRVLNS